MATLSPGYSGTPCIELLSPQGSNPLASWRVGGGGKSATKAYDTELRGSAFSVHSGGKLSLPRDERSALGISQPFLLLQLCLGQVRGGWRHERPGYGGSCTYACNLAALPSSLPLLLLLTIFASSIPTNPIHRQRHLSHAQQPVSPQMNARS